MAEYIVGHRYESFRDGQRFGPYLPGDTVDLTEVDAEWVNRDSPGTLTHVADAEPEPTEPEEVPEPVEPEAEPVEPEPTGKPPAANRQAKPAARRGKP